VRFTNTGRGSSGVTLLGSNRDFAIYTGNPSPFCRVFTWTGVPSSQLPVPGGAGARRLRGAGIRPTVGTEPSTVPGTDPTRRASNARGAQIQTLTTFRVASPPPNQARMRNHFFEAAVPGGTMAVPRIGRPTTT